MANLFFIHTPLQLMIAQMIIEQENLTDNVMLCGYVDDNRQFLQLYDLIRIEDMWKAIEPMDDVARWAMFSRKKLLSGTYKVLLRYRYICRVVKKHKIGTLFLGDMKNGSCQLAAMTFHRKGLKICFFEEGAGHYHYMQDYNYGVGTSLINKCFSFFIDLVYYLPFFGVSYENLHSKGFRLEYLPMDIRYSVVPYYHEPYDILISCKLQIPDRIKRIVNTELKEVTKGDVLMLTSPFYIYRNENDDPSLYIKIIVDTLYNLHGSKQICIKFHPREKQAVVDQICQQLNSKNVIYRILGKSVNVPIEYYLNMFLFDEVLMFDCSSSYYNGYLFPETKFTSIMPAYYELCKSEGHEIAKYLECSLR